MSNINIILQIIIGISLLNVWIFRYKKETKWRGGLAKNMKEEFVVYGLPSWFMYLVGSLKILIALFLFLGIWFDFLVKPASILLMLLMLGAVVMHIKVKDTYIKALPAFCILLCSIFLFVFS
jgi:uncharacterized membrane protein YphA (DoxX/SURF4 family)